ncbi:protein TIS11 [Drosophila madeirensis]|uniref:Protein TIS11 n=1 Tax=Drosophila madeirensis TaxID=30013 RepID=A0AAU9G135_DROMD
MSATIVQKSTASVGNSHYFECGDIFQTVASDHHQPQQQQQQQQQTAEQLILDINMEQSSQSQQQHRLHGALTRTISQPAQQRHPLQQQQIQQQQQQQIQQQQQPQGVASLVTIIENLGNMNLHRKLERTQSEPLPQQPMNISRYKTELCRPFEEAGECKYGEKCQFAHGYHELRNLQRHPKYKTEYCRTFHSVGFCPYGPRCHFVHNADEARAQQQAAAQAAKSGQQQQQQQSSGQQQQQQQGQQQQQQQQGFQKPSQLGSQTSISQSINISQSPFFMPLSPPLSMSTGSDRESPTGSLSLSPTNSLTSFPFHDAMPPQHGGYLCMPVGSSGGKHGTGGGSSASSTSSSSGLGLGLGMGMGMAMGPATPPESPNVPISPVHTPPPYEPSTPSSSSSSSSSMSSGMGMGMGGGGGQAKQLLQKSMSTPMQQEEMPRLPVFNRLSSAVEDYQKKLLSSLLP